MTAEHDGNVSTNGENATIIQLRWEGAIETPTIYVDQLLVARTQDTCFLVFGEIDPIAHPAPLEQVPGYMPITPRVKLAVPINRVPSFVRLIQDSLATVMQDDDSSPGIETSEEAR